MGLSRTIPLLLLVAYMSPEIDAADTTEHEREAKALDIQRFFADWKKGGRREADDDSPRFGGWKPGRREADDVTQRFGGLKPGGRREIENDSPRFGGGWKPGRREAENLRSIAKKDGSENDNPFKKLFGRESKQLVNKDDLLKRLVDRENEINLKRLVDDAAILDEKHDDVSKATLTELSKREKGPFGRLFGRDVEKRWPSLSALLHSKE